MKRIWGVHCVHWGNHVHVHFIKNGRDDKHFHGVRRLSIRRLVEATKRAGMEFEPLGFAEVAWGAYGRNLSDS